MDFLQILIVLSASLQNWLEMKKSCQFLRVSMEDSFFFVKTINIFLNTFTKYMAGKAG